MYSTLCILLVAASVRQSGLNVLHYETKDGPVLYWVFIIVLGNVRITRAVWIYVRNMSESLTVSGKNFFCEIYKEENTFSSLVNGQTYSQSLHQANDLTTRLVCSFQILVTEQLFNSMK